MFDDVAVEMVAIHNCFIRGINSIYLQAPHVKPAEAVAFANYAVCWYNMVHMHHQGEEDYFFPGIDKIAGESNLMEANVEQHHAFHEGLEAFGDYTRDCAAGRKPFDGAHLVTIIDSFAGALTQHLRDEIPTLIGLRRFGAEKFKDYPAMAAGMAQNGMKHAGFTTGIVFVLMCHDITFEDGRWLDFPPAPKPLLLFIRYVCSIINRSWWRFAPCDYLSRPRPLYAVPNEG